MSGMLMFHRKELNLLHHYCMRMNVCYGSFHLSLCLYAFTVNHQVLAKIRAAQTQSIVPSTPAIDSVLAPPSATPVSVSASTQPAPIAKPSSPPEALASLLANIPKELLSKMPPPPPGWKPGDPIPIPANILAAAQQTTANAISQPTARQKRKGAPMISLDVGDSDED